MHKGHTPEECKSLQTFCFGIQETVISVSRVTRNLYILNNLCIIINVQDHVYDPPLTTNTVGVSELLSTTFNSSLVVNV